jgi:predicted aspartyl protease
MKGYKLEKHGNLFMVRAYVAGPAGDTFSKLLLDTGSAYTILAKEVLYSIGCNLGTAERSQRIITGSGYEIVPVVSVNKFNCLGQNLKHFNLLAHTLPSGVYVDGLLGMDFLSRFNIEIKISSGEIVIR